MTEQKITSHWKRITLMFIGLLMLAALLPVVSFGALKGSGTETDPYITEQSKGIRFFRSNENGEKFEELNQTDKGISITAGQKDPFYILVTQEDGQTPIEPNKYYSDPNMCGVFQFTTLDIMANDWNYMKINDTSGVDPANMPWWQVPASALIKLDVSEVKPELAPLENKIELTITLDNGGSGTAFGSAWSEKAAISASASIPLKGLNYPLREGLVLTGHVGEKIFCGSPAPEPGTTTDPYTITATSSNQNVIADSDIRLEKKQNGQFGYDLYATPKRGGTLL